MNNQTHTPNHKNNSQLFAILALLVSAFAMLLNVFTIQNLNVVLNAMAKNPVRKPVESDTRKTIEMVSGDSVTLKCTSWNLLTQRKGRDTLTAWCSNLPALKPTDFPVGIPQLTPFLTPPEGDLPVNPTYVPMPIEITESPDYQMPLDVTPAPGNVVPDTSNQGFFRPF